MSECDYDTQIRRAQAAGYALAAHHYGHGPTTEDAVLAFADWFARRPGTTLDQAYADWCASIGESTARAATTPALPTQRTSTESPTDNELPSQR